MKTVVCYGDSNTWGLISGSRNTELMLAKRLNRNQRWTGILQELLGSEYIIVEAGLTGRNICFDETRFTRPSRNGIKTLPLILEMNYPIDLVILMLGTNDTQAEFVPSTEKITLAMQEMIRFIKKSHFGPDFKSPQVLLISPAPIKKIDSVDFNLFFNDNSILISKELSSSYKELAQQENCSFLDAAQFVQIDQDGIHIDMSSQKNLALAISLKVKEII